jgi:hypothetical protein
LCRGLAWPPTTYSCDLLQTDAAPLGPAAWPAGGASPAAAPPAEPIAIPLLRRAGSSVEDVDGAGGRDAGGRANGVDDGAPASPADPSLDPETLEQLLRKASPAVGELPAAPCSVG